MNKVILSGVLAIISLFISGLALQADKQPSKSVAISDDKLVMYYGNTCPHCKNVEKFLEDNPAIAEKTQIKLKEVYDDTVNRDELVERAKTCKLDTQKIAVPFLWDNGECVLGDEPIIEHLKAK